TRNRPNSTPKSATASAAGHFEGGEKLERISKWQQRKNIPIRFFRFDFLRSLPMLSRHTSIEIPKRRSLSMLSLLGTLIIGLIVGAIAKLIVPGKEPGGCLITMGIGVAGSFSRFTWGEYLAGLLDIPPACGRLGLFRP